MTARTVMVQGTASSVGKSVLVTALCRMFRQDGLRVAPFKAQNMALNAYVTVDGREIGRAQAVQAEAAGVEATVDMNPILLKPEGDARSQVVVLGTSIGSMAAAEYHQRKPELRGIVTDALARLRACHDVVVIEGAGNPAEINLRDRDIVNMFVARIAEAPVLLVGDIDRGGVFAAMVGTMELLEPEDRARVAAFVVNRFRGDIALLRPGLEFLEQRTRVPVLGVVPHVPRLRVAEEDSLSLDQRRNRRRARRGEIDIVVVCLPRISNYDEFAPLEHEAGVVVRFVETPEQAEGADLLIIPGSKSTVADLAWLRESGLAEAIGERARAGSPVMGICGGCQMLGARIDDPDQVESKTTTVPGLGLIPAHTRFGPAKTTARVVARIGASSFLGQGLPVGTRLDGYEIHMGKLERVDGEAAAFEVVERNGSGASTADGAVGHGGTVVGTMVHGLFENAALRASFLGRMRSQKGLVETRGSAAGPTSDEEYERLARVVRESLDMRRLARIVGLAT